MSGIDDVLPADKGGQATDCHQAAFALMESLYFTGSSAELVIECDPLSWKVFANQTKRPYRPQPSEVVVPHPGGLGLIRFRRRKESEVAAQEAQEQP